MILSHIIRDSYLRVCFGASVLLALASFGIFYYKFYGITAPLVVHFDAFEGIDFLGGSSDLFGIALTAILIIVINTALADVLYPRERFLSYVFGFMSALFALLILIAVFVILGAN